MLVRLVICFGLFGPLLPAPDAGAAEQSAAPPSPQIQRPVPEVRRAVIISVDGLRPDLMLRARTPVMRGLMDSGSFSLWARTVKQSVTLPSHTSMLTGVSPEKHGVLWNSDKDEEAYPKVPTLFEVAKKAGLTTAMVTGKSKFDVLARPGSVDWLSVARATDAEVGSRAASVLTHHKPDLLVVHFPGCDGAGHSKGWGSPQQMAAIEAIDRSVGVLFSALDESRLRDQTLVILSADHGGAGRGHGPDDPRCRHIPWIASGPGVRRNYDLTQDGSLVINTEDTFATACYFLGLRPDGPIDGKPIEQVLAGERELLRDVKESRATSDN